LPVIQRNARDNDDAALVQRCLADDGDAWRELVDRYRPTMIDLTRRILPYAAAVDVVDAVVADLWHRRKLEAYQGRSSLRTWLGAVVVNAALNERRSLAARPEAGATADESEPVVFEPEAGEPRLLSTVLQDAIRSLSPSDKSLVLMYYEQDLTLDAIAGLLGTSKSTLSRRLRDAREHILLEARRLAKACGTTLESLRSGVDLTQLDVDLRSACAVARDRRGRRVSNS
jgi:RNA polymerase sigma-70 factor, ECF subfamily